MADRSLTSTVRTPLAPLAAAAVKQLATLEADLGGRDVLIGTLALAPLNKDGKYFLNLLSDPERGGSSLLALIQESKLRPGQVISWVEAGLTSGSQLRARVHIAARTPAVVADVMKLGAPYEDPCQKCQGTGSITADPTETTPNPSPGPCSVCLGTGALQYPADADARKLALDLSGMLPKNGGISITNTNNQLAVVAGGTGDLDLFQEAMDRILYGAGGAPTPAAGPDLEAEILPTPPEASA